MENARLRITGMKCAMCAKTIESSLTKLDGIERVNVNLATEYAHIVYDPLKITLDDIVKEIEKLGYGAEIEKRADSQEKKDIKKLLVAIIAGSVLFAVPLPSTIQILIATPTLLYAGIDIFSSAFRTRTLNMDVMYSMGVGSAYIASVLSTLKFFPPEYTFYDTSVILLAFLLIGRTLEERAKGKTGEAIKKLMELQVKSATLLRDNKEVKVRVEEVKEGDIVIVRPGEKIPVDGLVVGGVSYVEEAMITGEPMPKLKEIGDEVFAGTINKSGVLKIRASGEETLLSQIIKTVEEAIGSKPPIQRFADKIVSYFIPVVLSIALISFAYWYTKGDTMFAFTTLIAVLVVACPCAFGLATPTALTVGMGKGAEYGILIKNGEVLEIARNVRTVVFDKTGTLTKGEIEVSEVRTLDESYDVLKLAMIAEKNSTHPIAEAIMRYGSSPNKVEEPEMFEEVPGEGVVAVYKGSKIAVGNKRLMERVGVDIEGENNENEIIVALNNKVIGVIEVKDEVKESAKEVVDELHRMGKKVVMITGDSRKNAELVAKELNIDEFFAEVLPHEKAEIVRKMEGVVAFVGDGINDAPALAQADVGIAIGTKKIDIAVESGDIVLVRDNLKDVVRAIKLSERTYKKIKQNIFWAIVYNTILIPVAAGILYPFFGIIFRPEWAGMAMAMSSVSVVTNSLLLRWSDVL